MHCAAYSMMEQAQECERMTLPNDRQRVKHLLDNVDCLDALLQATMVQVCADATMRDDYE